MLTWITTEMHCSHTGSDWSLIDSFIELSRCPANETTVCFCVCAPQLCQAKGFVCEFCGNGKDIIFPFDLNKCQRCEGEPSPLVAGLVAPRAPSPNPFPAPPWKDWKFPKPRRLARALLQDKREGEGGEEVGATKGEGDENGRGEAGGVREAWRRSKDGEVEEETIGEEQRRDGSEVGCGEEGVFGMEEEEGVEPGKVEVRVGRESGDEPVRAEKVTLRKALGIDRLVNAFARREQSDSQASDSEPQADGGGRGGGGLGKEEGRGVWKAPAFKNLGKRFSKIDTESEEERVEVQKTQKASDGETAQGDVGRKDVGRAAWKVSGLGKLARADTGRADTGRAEAGQEEGMAGKASAREPQDVGKAVWIVSPVRTLGKGTERVEEVEVPEEGVPDAARGTEDEERVLGAAVAGKALGGAAKAGRFPGLYIPKPPSLTSIFSRGRNSGGGGGGGGGEEDRGGGDSTREGEEERGVDVEKAGPDDGSEGSQKNWRSRKTRRARRRSQGRRARSGEEARTTPPGGGGGAEPSKGGGSVEEEVGASEEH